MKRREFLKASASFEAATALLPNHGLQFLNAFGRNPALDEKL
jgi:hypothetical protein